MSAIDAKKLVRRLKDDETFRKSIRAADFAQAWRLVEEEGYACSCEEVQAAYDNFGCGITGPRSAWREAVKKLSRLPLRYPGPFVNKNT